MRLRFRAAVAALRRPDAGQATAETAVVVPSLVLLTAMLLWGLLAAAAHIQCIDAARSGARAAARGEPWPRVTAAAEAVAPPGAHVEAAREDDFVRVRVRARSVGPGPLAVELRAEAVAQAEQVPPPPGGAADRGSGGTGRASPAAEPSPERSEQQ